MSHESTKTREIRPRDFVSRYLNGRVIDIGCGPDPIVPHAEPFDLDDGDAQQISQLRPKLAYDAVCSSHCLEHMRDVPAALGEWWRLLKPGGYLILVVPDEDLYEQGAWPSLFNSDHKATFRLEKSTSWSPISYDVRELVASLPGAEILSAQRQSHRYDDRLCMRRISYLGRRMFVAKLRLLGWLRRSGVGRPQSSSLIEKALFRIGVPVDQTAGPALAQIEIIARKSAEE